MSKFVPSVVEARTQWPSSVRAVAAVYMVKCDLLHALHLSYDPFQAVTWCCLGVEERMVSLDMGMQKTGIILKLSMHSWEKE